MKKIFFLLFFPIFWLFTGCQKNNTNTLKAKQLKATVMYKAWSCNLTLIKFESNIAEIIEAMVGESGAIYGKGVYAAFNLPESVNENRYQDFGHNKETK